MLLFKHMLKKHYWLYVLKLKNNKYYVGITTQTPEARFIEHKNGIRPAKWTIKYQPIAIVSRKDLGMVTRVEAESYENKVVRKYIKKYGSNSTRGGDLTFTEEVVNIFGSLHDKEYIKAILVILFLMFLLLLKNFNK